MRAPAEGSQLTCETYGEEKVILVPPVHFSLCSPVPTCLLPTASPNISSSKDHFLQLSRAKICREN